MAFQFAERARRGEADNEVGCDIYEFFQGNQVICIIGLHHPTGHIEKLTTKDMERRRLSARKCRNVGPVAQDGER